MDDKTKKQSVLIEDPTAEPEGLMSLFAARTKTYPAKVNGRYRQLKWLIMAITLGIYYITPWIRWDRGPGAPDQSVLIDIHARKFYFFFIELWPQEIYYFTGLLLLAAFGLFFVTAMAGRVWCGYTCPQTVWTDLFVHVERWIEGDRNARIKLDHEPWSLSKLRKRFMKHSLWLLIGMATGGAWVFYFNDAPTLVNDIYNAIAHGGTLPFTPVFWIGVLTLSTYLFAGFAREQVCTYMCPYARFQGAMFDIDSLIVSYDEKRGEPRGKGGDEQHGDCVDCGRCVAVCPMGIDIRNGQQYTCINCALCIDACNAVMEKLGRPRGLIRYNTFDNKLDKEYGIIAAAKHLRLIRPRTIIYTTLMVTLASVMAYALFVARALVDINVLRDRNPLYITMADGSIRNAYTIRVLNKQHQETAYNLSIAEQPEGAKLVLQGEESNADRSLTLVVGSDSVAKYRVYVDVPMAEYKPGISEITFNIDDAEGNTDSYTNKFVAPEHRME